MTDYIERDAAEKALDEACRYYPTSFYNGISVSVDVIHKLPAADVRPVVRGRWIVHDYGAGDIKYECSECKDISCCGADFCPDCGADMREAGDAE